MGGNFKSTALQKSAAIALQLKEAERQASRNVSPVGVRDRPGTVPDLSDDKFQLAREGRIRRSGEGVLEAKELIMNIKRRGKTTGKLKLCAVEKRLLESPLIDAFHSKYDGSNKSAESTIRSIKSSAEKKRRMLRRSLQYEDEGNTFTLPPVLLKDNEKIVTDEIELRRLARNILFDNNLFV